MTVFRWLMGVIWVLLAAPAAVTFLLYVGMGDDRFVVIAGKLRRLLWAASLFWFNVEIWGRVVWTLVHWGG